MTELLLSRLSALMIRMGCYAAAEQVALWLEVSECPLSEQQRAALTKFFESLDPRLNARDAA